MFDYPKDRCSFTMPFKPLKELFRMQREGKFLTFEEKRYLQKEAESRRKQRK